VYCIEHGRWQGGDAFQAGGFLPGAELREQGLGRAAQSAVWETIRETTAQLSVSSETQDYAAVPRDPRVSNEASEIRHEIQRHLPRRTVGLVVTYGPEVLGVDVFGNAGLFSALRDAILDSYALQAMIRQPLAFRPAESRRAHELLARIRGAQYWPTGTPAAGYAFGFGDAGVNGRVLADRGGVVHLEASVGRQPVTLPHQRPQEDLSP
jgi:hypothetical protein